MTARNEPVDSTRLKRVVEEVVAKMAKVTNRGKAPDRKGAKTDPKKFGIAILTCGGEMATGGDADQPFFIQSISKIFALTLALERCGEDVWKRVGREPSGDPFNSIVDLERHKGIPRNPLINAGALVVIDMLLDRARKKNARDFVRDCLARQTGDETIRVDEEVARREKDAGFSNRALANLSKAFDNLHHDVDEVMEVYVRQCVIPLTCRQLAKAGRYLMLDTIDPAAQVGREQVRRARRVNSLMLTCGQYDGSGEFAYRVGLPAKSGVGGGILAIVPNIASIAVWSPGLDEDGNSRVGTLALEKLSERMNWSIFGAMKPEDRA